MNSCKVAEEMRSPAQGVLTNLTDQGRGVIDECLGQLRLEVIAGIMADKFGVLGTGPRTTVAVEGGGPFISRF